MLSGKEKKERETAFILVEDRRGLESAARALKKEPRLGVDLEADSLFHYREQVCLMQISTASQNLVVDPLAVGGLSALVPVFADHRVQKVFHGADNDIRSLHRDFGIEVNGLFDTQIAARFVGYRETGLAGLLKERLGVLVDKKFQKKDWSQRPLAPEMLEYAVQDTSHLLALHRLLEDELIARKRLIWVWEECELLSRVREDAPENGPLFLKFKGARHLDNRGLAVLESLLQWRDGRARERNVPPFKVLGNRPIMEMAMKRPRNEAEVAALSELSTGLKKRLGNALLDRVQKATRIPESELPTYPKNRRQKNDASVSKKIKKLKAWRTSRAREMGIDPSLVCTNAQIQAVALCSPRKEEDLAHIKGLREWQRDLFGGEICSLL
jgi:ribonuclease D